MPALREVTPGRWWRRPEVGFGIPMLVGILHVALVAPHYFVGSFDDDSSYVLSARALLSGLGLTGHLASGEVVVGLYPPGYSGLIAPLVWIWPHSFLPLRLLSVVCFAAAFPLTWIYLSRRGLDPGLRVATLFLLALGPPFATYGSMVMAETPFIVVLLLTLLLVDRWEAEPKVLTATGIGVVVSASALIWLKQAGIGVVAGLLLWLVLRPGPMRIRRTAALGGGVILFLLPVVIARLSSGIPLAGSLYSSELGGYYQGGLVDRIIHVVPHSAFHLFSTALPATLVPYLAPVPIHGHWPDVWKAVSWSVTILSAVGGVAWFRRHRDAAVAVVPVYLLESVLWPYVNERRVILILPIVAAWFVLGTVTVWTGVGAWAARRGWLERTRMVALSFVMILVVGPLVVQMPRDYLFSLGQSSSHFGGSRYADLLSHLGLPSDVVETDYVSSTALFTGHATARAAFDATLNACYFPGITSAVAQDQAGFLLLGDVNKPHLMDSPCLLAYASSSSSAVRLLHTTRDDASVFELIGPGTAHPGLEDLTSGLAPRTSVTGTSASVEWDWGAPRPVLQVSVGEANLVGGPTASVRVDLQEADGRWVTVAAAAGPVGDGAGFAPYLLARLPVGTTATALRVTGTGPSQGAPLSVDDVHALGPTA